MKVNRIITLVNGEKLKLTSTFWDKLNSSWQMKCYHDGKKEVVIPIRSILMIERVKIKGEEVK